MIDAGIMLATLDDLRARYNEPHRHYHTLDHIEDMFAKEQTWRQERTGSPDVDPAMAWAIWFHDAIYDPRGSRNEENSAELAHAALARANVPYDIIFPVMDLVLSTKRHEPHDDSEEASMFLDLDLSILGSPPEEYQYYMSCIRLEYSFVPAEIYYPKRAEVLKSFLFRGGIFITNYARAKWEQQARENIVFELEFNDSK